MSMIYWESHEPFVLEKVRESLRLVRAGMDRYEKKSDPSDKEILVRIYSEISSFVDEMEMRLGLIHDDCDDDED